MLRPFALHLVCFVALAAPAFGQEWATKMFKESKHEFGTVARGAKTEYEFEFQNIYKEDVHIASVRASCGCTTPTIKKDLLKTWEKGAIHCRFNTDTFLGQRGATVTVTIDKPFYAEVQLKVSGYIRSDVVFEPGVIDFGDISVGSNASRSVKVNYSGRSDWSIADVRSANPNFEVELNEPTRNGNQVGYNMTVRLKPTAAPGYLQDELTLVTNDQRNKTITLAVQGRISSPLEIKPDPILLGEVKSGESITKTIVLKGKDPFKIAKVASKNANFEFKFDATASKNVHMVQVIFNANGSNGEINDKIMIETDSGLKAECSTSGSIQSIDIERPAVEGVARKEF